MFKIPNYFTSESIKSQKNKILKQIDISKQNSLLLAQRQQDYFKNQIEPINETQDLTTEQLMGDMIKLKAQLSNDVKELTKDFQTINEVLNDNFFDDIETLQIVVQIFPKIKFELTQGKNGQRFMSSQFIIQSIKRIIEKWKLENDIKDIVIPETNVPDGPVVNDNKIDNVLDDPLYKQQLIDSNSSSSSGSTLAPIPPTPFEQLDTAKIEDFADELMKILETDKIVDVTNESQIKNDILNFLNQENGYTEKFELANLYVERLLLENQKEITEKQIETSNLTRAQKTKLINVLAVNKSKIEKNENYFYEKQASLNDSISKFDEYIKITNDNILEQNKMLDATYKNIVDNQKQIKKTQILNNAGTDIKARNEAIDMRLDELISQGITVPQLKNIAKNRQIKLDKKDLKSDILGKIREGLKEKDLGYQVQEFDTTENKYPDGTIYGFGFINKDGVYVPNKQIGKGIYHSKYKNIKIGRGLEIPEEKKPVYIQFGNFIIHQKQLFEDNILNLKYKTMGSTLIKRQLISQSLSDLIKHIIEYGKIQQKDYDILSDNEKKLFDDIIDKSLLRDIIKYNRVSFGNGIKNNDMVNINDEIKRFTLLKGIIYAGNDNPDIINEFKILLKKFIDNNRINPNEENIILNML